MPTVFKGKGSKSQQAPASSGLCSDSPSLTKPALNNSHLVCCLVFFFYMPLTHTYMFFLERKETQNLCDVHLE